MSTYEFDLGIAPQITLAEARGDVAVGSWPQGTVLVKGEAEAVQTEKGLKVTATGDVQLRLPEGATLVVVEARGDLSVRNVHGAVELADVSGDVSVRGAADVQIGRVRGDLVVANADGQVTIDEVAGDVTVRRVRSLAITTINGDFSGQFVEGVVTIGTIEGDISLGTVNDDLTIALGSRDANLSNLGGMNQVTRVKGDVRLRGGLAAGKHTFVADGDIVVRWPLNEPVKFLITASEIVNRLPLEDVTEAKGSLTGRVGEGETTLILEAGGQVVLKELPAGSNEPWAGMERDFADFGLEMAGLGEKIASEMNARMVELSTQFETRFGPEFAQKLAEKAARKAELAMDKAARHAERQARRAEQRAGRGFPPPPPPPPPRRQPSATEQLKVLEMLEKGIISVEEANTLLKAMEG
ncbi:MAG: hypothetical protein H6666_17390 [Ardenticatenaceae bacterium]|nr:hypothetical protein [Anaerolineales bacterium]MCB8919690.1 hypothetical protein [Ardenticatenaceae bacterium]